MDNGGPGEIKIGDWVCLSDRFLSQINSRHYIRSHKFGQVTEVLDRHDLVEVRWFLNKEVPQLYESSAHLSNIQHYAPTEEDVLQWIMLNLEK